ncbi:MAG: hypothetical protein ACPGYT_12160 [Nitrospirales bacterium]
MNTCNPYPKRWVTVMMVALLLTSAIEVFGKDGLRKYESHGLSFQHPSDLKAMKPASTKQIQGILNQQLRNMGNTQVSVIALDVLLDLPAFRVMIAKEQFTKKPSPSYLIEERKHFLAEAQKRGLIQSYGEIKETQISTYSAIEFRDLDKGTQGYGSRVRILCGKDTWNFTFSGSNRKTYEQHQSHIQQIMQSVVLPETC